MDLNSGKTFFWKAEQNGTKFAIIISLTFRELPNLSCGLSNFPRNFPNVWLWRWREFNLNRLLGQPKLIALKKFTSPLWISVSDFCRFSARPKKPSAPIYYSIREVEFRGDIWGASDATGPLMSRECLLFPWCLVFRVAFHIKFQERWTVTRYFKFWKPVELFAALHLKTGIVCRAKLSSTVCINIWDCVVSEAWLRFVNRGPHSPPTPTRSAQKKHTIH